MKVTLPDGTICDSLRSPTEHPCPDCTTLQCEGRGYAVKWAGGEAMNVLVVGKPLQVGPNIVAFGEPMCDSGE
jgi:hypothetical protein